MLVCYATNVDCERVHFPVSRFPHVLKYLDSDESDEEVKLPLASVEFISDVEDEGRFEVCEFSTTNTVVSSHPDLLHTV